MPNLRAPRRDDQSVAAHLRRLFPGKRRTDRLGRAFQRSRTSMEEIMAGRNVPRDVRLIVGLLAVCPPEFWPPVWQECRDQAAESQNRDRLSLDNASEAAYVEDVNGQ